MAWIELNDIDVKSIAVGQPFVGGTIDAVIDACRDWVEQNPTEPLPGTVISWKVSGQFGEFEYVAVRRGQMWSVAGDAAEWTWDKVKRSCNGKFHVVRT